LSFAAILHVCVSVVMSNAFHMTCCHLISVLMVLQLQFITSVLPFWNALPHTVTCFLHTVIGQAPCKFGSVFHLLWERKSHLTPPCWSSFPVSAIALTLHACTFTTVAVCNRNVHPPSAYSGTVMSLTVHSSELHLFVPYFWNNPHNTSEWSCI